MNIRLFGQVFICLISIESLFANIRIPLDCYKKERAILIRFEGSPINPDLKELEEWIKEISLNKEYDWFNCAQELSLKIRDSLYSETDLDYRQVSSILAKVNRRIADYGADAYAAGKIPYIPNKKIPKERLRELQKMVFEGSCEPDVKSIFFSNEVMSKDFLANGLPFMKDFDEEKYMGEGCRERLESFYARKILDISLSNEQCEINKALCNKRKEEIENILFQISLLPKIESEFKEILDNYKTCGLDIGHINQELRKLELGVHKITSCVPLKVGDLAPVRGNKGSGLSGHYTLKRLPDGVNSEKKYEIELPIFFRDKSHTGREDYFAEKASKCLKKNQKYFKGPNGESLNIKLTRPSRKLDGNIVNISEEKMRSNSKNWSPEIGCGAMLHEMFHLLGLVDEYKESAMGIHLLEDGTIEKVKTNADIKRYDCRTLGPADSIMANHSEALASVIPEEEVTSCVCDSGVMQQKHFNYDMWVSQWEQLANELDLQRKRCSRLLSNMSSSAKNCPTGSNKRIETFKNNGSTENTLGDYKGIGFGKTIKIDKKKPKRLSLFYPAQFRYLVNPGCILKNKTYIDCASTSQLTSVGAYESARCKARTSSICHNGGESWLK